jgi:hypothetical protein
MSPSHSNHTLFLFFLSAAFLLSPGALARPFRHHRSETSGEAIQASATAVPTSTASTAAAAPAATTSSATSSSAGDSSPAGGPYTGGWATYYTDSGLTYCGDTIDGTGMYAAISGTLTDSWPGFTAGGNTNMNPYCVNSAGVRTIRNIELQYDGRSITVQALDRCAACGESDIDLSPQAFEQLFSSVVGTTVTGLAAGKVPNVAQGGSNGGTLSWNWA